MSSYPVPMAISRTKDDTIAYLNQMLADMELVNAELVDKNETLRREKQDVVEELEEFKAARAEIAAEDPDATTTQWGHAEEAPEEDPEEGQVDPEEYDAKVQDRFTVQEAKKQTAVANYRREVVEMVNVRLARERDYYKALALEVERKIKNGVATGRIAKAKTARSQRHSASVAGDIYSLAMRQKEKDGT